MPDDIILYSAMYNGQNYPVKEDGTGKYIEISLGTLKTTGMVQTIILNYKYDFVQAPDERLINVIYTGTRDGLGTEVVEYGTVKDLVYPEGMGGGADGDGTAFFIKEGSSTVLRESGQKIIYNMELRPEGNLRDVYLIDDPSINESEYFNALRFSKISWDGKKSINPALTSVVKTKVSYQTNKNTQWKAVSSQYSASGQISVSSLNLDSDEYITKVKFDFNYEGKSDIPNEAGKVVMTMEADTLGGIQNSTSGLNDGITNTLSIHGKKKVVGASAFTDIDESEGKNVRKFTTTYVDRGAGLGLSNSWLDDNWASIYNPQNPSIGSTFTHTINMNNVNGTGDLMQGIGYFILPANVEFKNVQLVNPQNVPNATFETRALSDGRTLVVVHYNRDIPRGYWNHQYGVKITCVGKSGTSATISSYFASEDPNQKYVHSTVNNYIETVGTYKQDTFAFRHQTINFLQHVDLSVKKTASLDGVNYSNNISMTLDQWNNLPNKEVYYKISVENNSSSKFQTLRIIDMLPELSDTLVLTSTPKNSSIATEFVSISHITSGDATVNYGFSENATYSRNKIDLTDFTATTGNTWTNFNGTSGDSSYTDANALKIDIDNLDQSESIEFIVKVKMPQPVEQVKVAWNSIAYGGVLDTGMYIIPGEPYKSGIYSSTYKADGEISGVAWEDENGNDMKDEGEILFKNIPVKLLDKNGDIVAETITDENGLYKFTGLFPGKYTVEMGYDGPQYMLSTPNVGGEDVNSDFIDWDNKHIKVEADVTLAESEKKENVDGGFYQELTVGDTVWYDKNANGQLDVGEEKVPGYVMTLVRLDDSGNHAGTEYTGTTNSSGIYKIYKVKPGKYKMVGEKRNGYVVSQLGTSPDGNVFAINESEGTWESGVLNLTSGDSNMNVDLGMNQTEQSISGSIFFDMDYDSLYNGETGDKPFLENVDENNDKILTIKLLDENGDVVEETDIDSSGGFIFTGVDPGEYYVQISVAQGYEEYLKCAPKFVGTTRGIVLNDVSIFNEDTITTDKITLLADSHISDQNLGLQPYYDLTVYKEDSESNERLEGAEFKLTSNGGIIGDIQTTDNDGKIVYEKLRAGDYKLEETKAPENYKLGDTVYDINVGSVKNFELSLMITNDKVKPVNPIDPPEGGLEEAGTDGGSIGANVKTGDTMDYLALIILMTGSAGIIVFNKRKTFKRK